MSEIRLTHSNQNGKQVVVIVSKDYDERLTLLPGYRLIPHSTNLQRMEHGKPYKFSDEVDSSSKQIVRNANT